MKVEETKTVNNKVSCHAILSGHEQIMFGCPSGRHLTISLSTLEGRLENTKTQNLNTELTCIENNVKIVNLPTSDSMDFPSLKNEMIGGGLL